MPRLLFTHDALIALQSLQYAGSVYRWILLSYRSATGFVKITPWDRTETPHTLFYSGHWLLEKADTQALVLQQVEAPTTK